MAELVKITLEAGSTWQVPSGFSPCTVVLIDIGQIEGKKHLCGGGGGE